MRLFKHLLQHKVAVFIVLILLFAQAACDLALPKYTSDIVDIGIQQSGVEHVTVEEMTSKTFDEISKEIDAAQSSLLKASYDGPVDGLYKLNDFGKSKIAELDEILARPLIEIHGSGAKDQAGTDDVASHGIEVESPGDNALSMLDEDASGSLLKQRAVSASIAEYEAAGYDLTGLRISYLLRIGAIMLLISALGMTISILIGFVAAKTGATIGRDLRRTLFGKVVSFTEHEVDKFSAASLITRGTNDIQIIQNVSILMMRVVLYAPILAIGGIVMVMVTNASLGWIVVAAILCVSVVIAVLFALTMPKFKIMQKLIDKVNLISREMLSGMPVIRSFDREEYEEGRFDFASTELMRTQLFTNRAMAFMMPMMMLIMNATSVAIVWFGGLAVQDGSIQTGDLIAFITYAMVIIMGFLMLGMIAIILPRANVAAGRIDEVVSCTPAISDPDPKDMVLVSDIEHDSKGVGIEFDNVTFCYDEDGECENALEHVSFDVLPGQTLAIVGPTGSGKSTILKLIERFYDATEGSIRIDGEDVRDMPQSKLRSMFGYVPQKAFLFSGTVRTNIAYSNEAMPERQIEKAIEIAQAKDFVSSREGGLDSEISQGGTNVSGGQRQRLAIARAVATDAKAYLFDDSFSALDYKTDAALRAALHDQIGGITCIIVAQRIATIMTADKIVVLNEGKVAGIGKHEELLSNCDEYREIAYSQLSEEELSKGGDVQ